MNPLIQLLPAADRLGILDIYRVIRSYIMPHATILYYHRVGLNNHAWMFPAISPPAFDDQVRFFAKKFKIVSSDTLLNDDISHNKNIILTFDDGYKDLYKYAFPILKKYGVSATIFLATGFIGGKDLFWWERLRYILWHTKRDMLKIDDSRVVPLDSKQNRLDAIINLEEMLKRVAEEKKVSYLERMAELLDVSIPSDLAEKITLSWEEIKEMKENDINFGAHTVTHPILTNIPIRKAEYEIVESKLEIEKRLKCTISSFSYPNGQYTDFNLDIINLIKHHKFKCAMTTIPGMISLNHNSIANPYQLKRLPANYCLSSAKLYTSGLYTDACRIFPD